MKKFNMAFLFSNVWAIGLSQLAEMEKFAYKANLDLLQQMPAHDELLAEINGDVATIKIRGIIEKRLSVFSLMFGGTATDEIEAVLDKVLENTNIKRIVLDIDSPGGSIDGVESLSNKIFAARQKKETFSVINELAASAAYWIASAANKVFLNSSTAVAGSIGVVAMHQDISKKEKEDGVKTSEIVAGKFKRITSNFEPLSNDGRAYLQERVDYIYSVFVTAVARNRGKSAEEVLAMADGKTYMGQQAIDIGLADSIFNSNQIIAMEGNLMAEKNQAAPTAPVVEPMSEDFLIKNHPQFYGETKGKWIAEGAKAERERIQAFEEIQVPGIDLSKEKFDGKTTADQCSKKILIEANKKGLFSVSTLDTPKKPGLLDSLKKESVKLAGGTIGDSVLVDSEELTKSMEAQKSVVAIANERRGMKK